MARKLSKQFKLTRDPRGQRPGGEDPRCVWCGKGGRHSVETDHPAGQTCDDLAVILRRLDLYDAAVARFLQTNDPAFLAPFAGRSVSDVTGRSYPFETDPNKLYRIAQTDSCKFEDVYRVVA